MKSSGSGGSGGRGSRRFFAMVLLTSRRVCQHQGWSGPQKGHRTIVLRSVSCLSRRIAHHGRVTERPHDGQKGVVRWGVKIPRPKLPTALATRPPPENVHNLRRWVKLGLFSATIAEENLGSLLENEPESFFVGFYSLKEFRAQGPFWTPELELTALIEREHNPLGLEVLENLNQGRPHPTRHLQVSFLKKGGFSCHTCHTCHIPLAARVLSVTFVTRKRHTALHLSHPGSLDFRAL